MNLRLSRVTESLYTFPPTLRYIPNEIAVFRFSAISLKFIGRIVFLLCKTSTSLNARGGARKNKHTGIYIEMTICEEIIVFRLFRRRNLYDTLGEHRARLRTMSRVFRALRCSNGALSPVDGECERFSDSDYRRLQSVIEFMDSNLFREAVRKH